MRSELIFVLVLILIMGAGIGGCVASDAAAHRACEALGEDTGNRTQYRDNSCLIEIAPDLFVDVLDIKYYLDHVEPVREAGE